MPPKKNNNGSNGKNGRNGYNGNGNGNGSNGRNGRFTRTRQQAATIFMKLEQQAKLVINGITADPTSLIFLIAAIVFTVSEAKSGKQADFLSELVTRLKENDITKPFGTFLSTQRALVFAFLWFAVAICATSFRNRALVVVFALSLVYVFHQRKSWEFAAMSMTLYAFFKIRVQVVRLLLVLTLCAIFWYYKST